MHMRESERLKKKLLDQIQIEKKNKPEHGQSHSNDTLAIHFIAFQKIQPPIRHVIEQNYNNIQKMNINNCDLRTFENFPNLPSLAELNASRNSLRGSFEYIVKNRALTYIDVSHNIIADIKRFEPFRILKNIKLYAKQNPFLATKISTANGELVLEDETIINRLKLYGIEYLKQSKEETEQKMNICNQAEQKKFPSFSIKMEEIMKQKTRSLANINPHKDPPIDGMAQQNRPRQPPVCSSRMLNSTTDHQQLNKNQQQTNKMREVRQLLVPKICEMAAYFDLIEDDEPNQGVMQVEEENFIEFQQLEANSGANEQEESL